MQFKKDLNIWVSNMTIINNAMKKYVTENCNINASFSVDKFVSRIISHSKEFFDCVLYCPTDEDLLCQVNMEKILQFYGDKTGYEAAVNDVNIKNDMYDPSQLTELSRKLVDGLNKFFFNKKFCVIISVDEHITHVRFHVIRCNELLWCDVDVERYREPVLLEIS